MLNYGKIFDICWLFIRGDMSVADFESWVYKTSELQSSFSEDFYLTLISTDFSLQSSVYVLKKELTKHIDGLATPGCECHTLPNIADVGMGEHSQIFQSLEQTAQYGEPHWWLSLSKCNVCGQNWMIASETRINDLFVMKRLSEAAALEIEYGGHWPNDFSEYHTLLEIGRDRGHSVRFVDPLSKSLIWTVVDLAKASPGIDIHQIAHLLQIDRKQAEAIVDEAIKHEEISVAQ